MALGRLPQLNTGGGDYSNALRGVMQAERLSRQEERQATQDERRNKLTDLQIQEAEQNLDPEVLELKKTMQKINVDTQNAMLKQQAIQNKIKSAEFVKNTVAPVIETLSPDLSAYKPL